MTVRYAAFTTDALPLAIAAGQSALATGVTSDGSCSRSRRTGSRTSAPTTPSATPPFETINKANVRNLRLSSGSSPTWSLALPRNASCRAWRELWALPRSSQIRRFAGVETMADDAALIGHARRCALCDRGSPSRGDAPSGSYAPG